MSKLSLHMDEFNKARDDAEAAGFTVVTADDNTLLLDLDVPSAPGSFWGQLLWMVRVEMAEPAGKFWRSKSGNLHVAVPLVEPWPLPERIAMQAALGSDPIREMLVLQRHKAGFFYACRLFRHLTSPSEAGRYKTTKADALSAEKTHD